MNVQNFSNKKPAERKLITAYRKLSDSDRKTLMDMAEFLAARAVEPVPDPKSGQPMLTPRPEQESVVKAIRRLSQSYHMLDAQSLFHDTSALMTQHVMQGRPAREIIDELEKLFESRYQQLLDGVQP